MTLHEDQKFSQNVRPTALSGLIKDRPPYILKTRIIELQTSFRLRQFFAGTLSKWRSIFLPRYFSLTKNSVAIGERCEWKSGLTHVQYEIFRWQQANVFWKGRAQNGGSTELDEKILLKVPIKLDFHSCLSRASREIFDNKTGA